MDFLILISWVAAAIGMTTTLPQLVRILRTKATAGVSTKLWQLNLLCAFGWAFHGFLIDVPALLWPNLLVSLMQTFVLWLICANEGTSWRRTMALPVVGALALVAADVVFGSAVFGLIALFPQLTGQVSQLLVMRRATDLHGVSPAYLGLTMVGQGLWATWGLSTGDAATTFSSGPATILVACSLMYYAHRRFAMARVRETVVIQIAA